MKKVLFITTIPSPYRVEFFNELGKYCQLTVLFEKTASDERHDTWKNYSFDSFNGIFLNGKKVSVNTAFCPEVKKYLTKDWAFVIVADVSTPTGMVAIETLRHRKIPYWIEGDGGFAKSGKGVKEFIKRYFTKGANGYFSTSKEHDRYYLTYGATKERIYRYPFTSISQNYVDKARIPFDKINLKQKLGIQEKVIVLAVGQFIHRKGFDILLKAFEKHPDDTGLYFVGGNPTAEYLELAEKLQLKNVHFVGFTPTERLMDYYRVADVFVLPTREDIWGLVINEAMAFSLPVITTDRCIAGLELVRNGENGYIVSADNVEDLHRALNALFALDENTRHTFGARSLEIIESYTIEKMVDAHLDCIYHNKE